MGFECLDLKCYYGYYGYRDIIVFSIRWFEGKYFSFIIWEIVLKDFLNILLKL